MGAVAMLCLFLVIVYSHEDMVLTRRANAPRNKLLDAIREQLISGNLDYADRNPSTTTLDFFDTSVQNPLHYVINQPVDPSINLSINQPINKLIDPTSSSNNFEQNQKTYDQLLKEELDGLRMRLTSENTDYENFNVTSTDQFKPSDQGETKILPLPIQIKVSKERLVNHEPNTQFREFQQPFTSQPHSIHKQTSSAIEGFDTTNTIRTLLPQADNLKYEQKEDNDRVYTSHPFSNKREKKIMTQYRFHIDKKRSQEEEEGKVNPYSKRDAEDLKKPRSFKSDVNYDLGETRFSFEFGDLRRNSYNRRKNETRRDYRTIHKKPTNEPNEKVLLELLGQVVKRTELKKGKPTDKIPSFRQYENSSARRKLDYIYWKQQHGLLMPDS